MKLHTALRLGRASNLPTVWTNVVAASVLAGPVPDALSLTLVCLAGSLLYEGGMFLNDAFDAEIDAKERPERPIPSGEVGRTQVYAWGFGLLLAGVLLAFSLRASAGLAALGTSAAIVLYNAWHKNNPASPIVMGACRMGVYAIGGFAASASPDPALWVGGSLLLTYVLGLTYAAKFENRGGVGRWAPLLGLAAPAVWVLFTWSGAPFLRSFLGGFALWVQRGISSIRSGKPKRIRLAIGQLIAGMCLLDALFVANSGSIGLAMACVAFFGVTLAFQARLSGT
ncbi:MAG: UbiA family prenyltransferase [Myxococcota bacterium]